MKSKLVPLAIVLVIIIGIVVVYEFQPPRLTKSRLKDALATQEELDRTEARREAVGKAAQAGGEGQASAGIGLAAAEPVEPDVSGGPVSDVFKVKFECSNGDFVVECHRDWAPIGVERFKALVEEGFFSDVRFFRVVTEPRPFVAQFGISGDPAVTRKWRDARIKDDPVKQSNTKGMLTFACAGPNSRTTQLFINLGENTVLDDPLAMKGAKFAPIGKVIEGMDVVMSLNDQYQGQLTPMQGQIMARGNAFLDERFPGLDYIKSAAIVE